MSSSCDPCKQRHLKCDRIRPICGKCQKSRAKLTCRYRDTRFRQSLLSILANPVPSSDGSPAVEPASEPNESPVNEDTSYLDSHAFSGTENEPGGPSVLSTPHHVVSPLEVSAHPRWQPNLSSPNVSSSGPLIGQDSPEQHGSVASSSKPVRITETESELFLFYMKQAGIWLDIVSPNRSFSQEVPRQALRNPLLYYSCLAYAAHVLCLQGHSDDASAHHYLNKAISYLIPLLNPGSMSATAQDGLLAAIAILRMSEQFLEPDEDAQTHIHGAFSLLTNSTIKWLPDRVDMSGAAFWVFIRQSLRICFLSEQPCQFDLDIIGSDNLFAPAADEVWTNRMTFLLAKACNACWTMSLHESQYWKEELDSLEADINCWFQSLPETFKPWFYQETPSQPFPRIYCLTSWHAIALQQYYTSKTLIAVYRKKQEAMKTYYETGRYWNSKILVPARLTCALVLSDTDVGSGVNGAHLAYWCGQFLMGRTEQYELLKWLENFMKKTKWPNRTCIDRLHKQWVLVPDDNFDRDLPPPV